MQAGPRMRVTHVQIQDEIDEDVDQIIVDVSDVSEISQCTRLDARRWLCRASYVQST